MAVMKRIVSVGPRKSEVVEAPIPEINDDQILIRIKYVGVCMSEHYDWANARPGQAFGHEPMGYVEKVGANVEDFKVGDRVSGLFGSNLPGSGGLVQYNVATVGNGRDAVVKVPDNVPDEDATAEPLACLLSAVSKVRNFVQGEKVCVVGCGYMGCGAIGLLKRRGAHVVAVDIRRESLEAAKRYGADEVYTPDELPEEYLPRGGRMMRRDKKGNFILPGFSRVMEWGETAESLDLAINLTQMCGQLCIGAYHTGGKRLVDVQQLNFKAIECLSTHPREHDLLTKGVFGCMELLSKGEWNYNHIPVKVYPYTKWDLAHEELETKYGKYMKAVIDMTWEDGEPYIVNEIKD